jgi:hypothetical protein
MPAGAASKTTVLYGCTNRGGTADTHWTLQSRLATSGNASGGTTGDSYNSSPPLNRGGHHIHILMNVKSFHKSSQNPGLLQY